MGLFDFFKRKPAAPTRKPLTKDELRALSESIRKTPARKVPAPTVPASRYRSPEPSRLVETRRDESASMLDPLNPLSPLSPISPLNPLNDTYYSSQPSYTPDPTPSCDTSSSYSSSSDSSSYSSSSSDSCSYDSGSSSSSSDSGSW